MKKILILCMAAMMTAAVMADNSIKNSFMGLTLGKATQKEVHKVLTEGGLELQTDTGGFYVYSGNMQIEGVPAQNMVTRFFNDTLMMVVYGYTCENGCDSLLRIIDTNIEKKYGSLQSGDSSMFINLFSIGLIPLNMEQWSRMDDETSFMYAKSDSAYLFIYLAEKYMWKQFAQTLTELTKETNPDYAEENRVTGVAGVKFGDSRYAVEESLTRRFGKSPHYDVYEIKYNNVMIGGSKWDYAIFYFKQNPNNRKHELISVSLQQIYKTYEKDEAEMAFDNVRSQYSGKYTNGYCPPKDDGSKICLYGMKTDDYPYPPISLTMDKSLSVGGDMFYYVTVDYYIVKLQGRYNDDI